MILKRVFDIFCSGVGLILLSPFMVIIAVAILIDSRGPIFFRQERIGLGLAPFRIHKFRTMHSVQRFEGPQITIGKDPRITRVGHFLRASKLDELPQLIDVFVGDMSIVGPRPEVPRYVDYYPDEMKRVIFKVRPGITDEASINFINESELLAGQEDPEVFYIEKILPIKNRYNRHYVENRSMMMDLGIVFRTFLKILKR